MTPLTVGSLFSGIGGLTVAWQSEIDPYCCRVLSKHWPHVPNLGDITLIDWSEVPRVDLICGGYPCQPFSVAGRRQGENDPRHLWPHMLDAIRVLRPRYALLENVPGHLALGFGRVLGDLAEIGYDTEWDCIPAAAVGAAHLRDRVFIVAYPDCGRHGGTQDGGGVGRVDRSHAGAARQREWARALTVDRSPTVADTDIPGSPRGPGDESRRPGTPRGMEPQRLGNRFAWQRPDPRGDWSSEPDVGRVAHGVPHRVDRLRALGNAVVPQVAEHIGRLIIEAAA